MRASSAAGSSTRPSRKARTSVAPVAKKARVRPHPRLSMSQLRCSSGVLHSARCTTIAHDEPSPNQRDVSSDASPRVWCTSISAGDDSKPRAIPSSTSNARKAHMHSIAAAGSGAIGGASLTSDAPASAATARRKMRVAFAELTRRFASACGTKAQLSAYTPATSKKCAAPMSPGRIAAIVFGHEPRELCLARPDDDERGGGIRRAAAAVPRAQPRRGARECAGGPCRRGPRRVWARRSRHPAAARWQAAHGRLAARCALGQGDGDGHAALRDERHERGARRPDGARL
mmetsp:Transcript_17516/g.54449  ORF Transcript_17516/g.54449 Transcript_17516/m.54449 type:complete len:288 (+) Transcript_17516:320-1183(+)